MLFRIENFQLGLVLATAFSISIWAAAAQAYTPEQQQACSGDAFRLCGPEIPDIDRVTACMVRNKAQLSPACRVYFRPDPDEVVAKPVGRPAVPKAVSANPRKSNKPAKPDKT